MVSTQQYTGVFGYGLPCKENAKSGNNRHFRPERKAWKEWLLSAKLSIRHLGSPLPFTYGICNILQMVILHTGWTLCRIKRHLNTKIYPLCLFWIYPLKWSFLAIRKSDRAICQCFSSLFSSLQIHALEFNITVPPSPSVFMNVMLEMYFIKAILHTVACELLKFPRELV